MKIKVPSLEYTIYITEYLGRYKVGMFFVIIIAYVGTYYVTLGSSQ